jgi:hypothetical protein
MILKQHLTAEDAGAAEFLSAPAPFAVKGFRNPFITNPEHSDTGSWYFRSFQRFVSGHHSPAP